MARLRRLGYDYPSGEEAVEAGFSGLGSRHLTNEDWDLLHPPKPELARYSFWKPEPLPPKDSSILPVELISLGLLSSVAEKLMEVPRMARVKPGPWVKEAAESINLLWEVDAGVILKVRTEQGPPKPGEVLTITAQNAAPEKTFYRLYVQIFEQLGVTVLDEKRHEFITPREFRAKLAG